MHAKKILILMLSALALTLSLTVAQTVKASSAVNLATNDVYPSGSSDWPMFHYDLARTGYTPSYGPQTNHTIWQDSFGGWSNSAPAVVNGIVYVGQGYGYWSWGLYIISGNFYALNATTGAQIWVFNAGEFFSSPAVAGGVVYEGSCDNNVYAFNATDGTQIWSYPTGGGVKSSPVVASGVVYVGSDDGHVYALDAADGTQIWNYSTGGMVRSSPTVANGIVYVGSFDGNVYALNAGDGSFIWNYTTGGPVESVPAVVNGVVYVGSGDGNIYALDASDGALVWKYTTGNYVFSSPAVADGIVYAGSRDGNVYALNATKGSLLWSYAAGSEVNSSPVVANGVVYVGSDGGNVYALDAADGVLLWSYDTGNWVWSSFAVVDGVAYVSDGGGNLYAFGPPQPSYFTVTFAAFGMDYMSSSTVVTVNGTAVSYADLPYSIYVNPGDTVVYSYSSEVSSTNTGKQFVFTGISGPSSPFVVGSSQVIMANYKIQYYLTVSSPYDTPSGQGWYDAGSTAYAMLSSGIVSGGSAVRYAFVNWGGGASGTKYTQSNPIIMDGPKTALAHWVTQYYLFVSSAYGTPTGTGWYNAGSTARFNVTSTTVSGGVGTQYVFTGWSSSDAGGYTGANVSCSVTMNNPITETAGWKTQYYLNVISAYGTPGGSGWYDINFTAYATLSSGTVSGGVGTQYVFTGWSGGASGSGLVSGPIVMSGPKTATAEWKTQYYLTVTSAFDSPSGQGWYDNGSTASSSVTSPVSGATGVRYVCTGWVGAGSASSGSGTSTSFVIDMPSSVTWGWSVQYQITFNQSGVGSDYGGAVVIVDGMSYGRSGASFWWDLNSSHAFSFISPLVNQTEVAEYVWSSTAGLSTSQSGNLVVTGSGSVVGFYTSTQNAVPEFPSVLILSLFMITTLLVVVFFKTKPNVKELMHARKSRSSFLFLVS